MELKECITCGSHSITNGKCDYCGNQYEVNEDKIFYGKRLILKIKTLGFTA